MARSFCAAAQDHREARGPAWRLLWVSKESSKGCCGLKWERSCFHVTKLFLIPAPFFCREKKKKKKAKEQGGIKEDWNTKFSFFLMYLRNTIPAPLLTLFRVLWHPWGVTTLWGCHTMPKSWGRHTSFSLKDSGHARRQPHTALDQVCFADWKLPLYSHNN